MNTSTIDIFLERLTKYGLIFLLFFAPISTLIIQLIRFVFDNFSITLPRWASLTLVGWKEGLLLLLLLITLGRIILNKKLPFRIIKADIALFGVVIIGTIYGYFVGDRSISALVFGFRYDYLVLGIYFIARTVLQDRSQIQRVIKKYIWWSVPILLFGILQTLLLPRELLSEIGYSWIKNAGGNPLPPYHLIGSSIVRAMSTFPGPNSFAMFASLILSLVIWSRFLRQKTGPSWLPILLIVISSLGLLLSFSRGHLISFVLANVIGFIIMRVAKNNKELPNKKIQIWSIVIVALFFIFGAGVNIATSRVASLSASQNNFLSNILVRSNSTDVHNQVRNEAINEIRTNPWGHGIGTAGLATTNYGTTVFNPESWVLQMLYEFGWLALALISAIIGAVVYVSLKMLFTLPEPQDKVMSLLLLVGFMGIAFSSHFLPSWYEVASIAWWILFGWWISDVNR